MQYLIKLLILFSLCFIMACSSDKTPDTGGPASASDSGNAASETERTNAAGISTGSHSIKINASEATRNEILTLDIKGMKPEDAEIAWIVNGNIVDRQPIPNQFNTWDTARSSTVQAKVTIGGMEFLSNVVTIINTPPELTKVKLMPEVFRPGDKLYIDAAARDVDDDNVSIIYEWTRNGESAGSGREIGADISRGDKVTVKITPYDDESYGRSITLNREISNMPPVMHEHKEFVFDGKTYSYQVRASDPDGDTLSYSLKEGPPGMTINSSTGSITWEVPADVKEADVTVLVSDNHGGELTAPLKIKMHAPEPSKAQ